MRYLIALLMISLLLPGCDDASRNKAPAAAPAPAAPAATSAPEVTTPAKPIYTVIDEHSIGQTRCSLDVRLQRKLSKEELTAIAHRLREGPGEGYQRMFINYYLPGMEPGRGAWAITHFDPSLRVEILGVTSEFQRAEADEPANAMGQVIGRWIDETPYAGGVLTMYRRNGGLFMHERFIDGSERTWPLTERTIDGEKRYEQDGNAFGEYYVIDARGDLRMCDRDGLISTARRRP